MHTKIDGKFIRLCVQALKQITFVGIVNIFSRFDCRIVVKETGKEGAVWGRYEKFVVVQFSLKQLLTLSTQFRINYINFFLMYVLIFEFYSLGYEGRLLHSIATTIITTKINKNHHFATKTAPATFFSSWNSHSFFHEWVTKIFLFASST